MQHDTTIIERVDYDAKRGEWQWITIPMPVSKRITTGLFKDYYFVGSSFYHGITTAYNTLQGTSLWQFDLRIKSWFLTRHPFAPLWDTWTTCSTINGSILVLYSPLRWSPSSVKNHLDINNTAAIWLFDTTIRRWTLCLERSNQTKLPTSRILSAMVDLGNGLQLLFGGLADKVDNTTEFNDLWRADVCDQKDYLPLRQNCVRWEQLTGNNSSSNYPSPRYFSSAFMSSGSLFVFGELRLNVRGTIQEMWQFEVDRLTWKKVQQKGFNPLGLCQPHAHWEFATWGTKVAVIRSHAAYVVNGVSCTDKGSEYTIIFDVRLSTWSRQAKAPSPLPMALTFWNEKLVALGRKFDVFWNTFTFLNPSCKVGQVSGKWQNESCESCPKGSYAALGAQQCSPCPSGLTSSKTNSTSLIHCVCRNDYCDNGE